MSGVLDVRQVLSLLADWNQAMRDASDARHGGYDIVLLDAQERATAAKAALREYDPATLRAALTTPAPAEATVGDVEALESAAAAYRQAVAPLDGLQAALKDVESRCYSEKNVVIGTREDFAARLTAMDALSDARHAAHNALSVLKTAALATPPAPAGAWHHTKTGNMYTEVGRAHLCVSDACPQEGDEIVIYQGADGRLWAREDQDFRRRFTDTALHQFHRELETDPDLQLEVVRHMKVLGLSDDKK